MGVLIKGEGGPTDNLKINKRGGGGPNKKGRESAKCSRSSGNPLSRPKQLLIVQKHQHNFLRGITFPRGGGDIIWNWRVGFQNFKL